MPVVLAQLVVEAALLILQLAVNGLLHTLGKFLGNLRLGSTQNEGTE